MNQEIAGETGLRCLLNPCTTSCQQLSDGPLSKKYFTGWTQFIDTYQKLGILAYDRFTLIQSFGQISNYRVLFNSNFHLIPLNSKQNLADCICFSVHHLMLLLMGVDPQVKFEQVSSDDHQMSVARG